MGRDTPWQRASRRLTLAVVLAWPLMAASPPASPPSPSPPPPAASAPASTPAPVTKEMSPDIAMPILGRTVYSPKGDAVGRIVDVLVDAAGLPQAVVLDVGGFLGVGNRIIAVHWGALRFHPTDKDHPITTNMPADEIAAAPQYVDTTAPAQVVVPHAAPPKPPASGTGQ